MGKYDHICELVGAENYFDGRKQMMLSLRGDCLWPHCSSSTDSSDYMYFASGIPTPADPAAVMDVEKEKIQDWLAKDAQAISLIQ
jgi:hypothetical protein